MSPVITAALITAVPAILVAIPGIVLLRRTKTNHGKNIGQHVEDLTAWAQYHTGQDAEQFAEIRAWLGMPIKAFHQNPPAEN